jgi:hypothetical protein
MSPKHRLCGVTNGMHRDRQSPCASFVENLLKESLTQTLALVVSVYEKPLYVDVCWLWWFCSGDLVRNKSGNTPVGCDGDNHFAP